MALSVKPKVSTLVKYQVPEAIRDNNPNFVEFLTQYYKFMEQGNGPVELSQAIAKNFSPDTNEQQFLTLMKKHVFPYVLDNVSPVISDNELIKFIRELYAMKGTEPSFKYVFEVLFNTKAELDYGKNYVFRSSDNTYSNLSYIILDDPINNSILYSLKGKTLTQGNASAVVEDVQSYTSIESTGTYSGQFIEGTNVIYNAYSNGYIEPGYINGGVVLDALSMRKGDTVIAPTWLLPAGTLVVAVSGNTITLSNAALSTSEADITFITAKTYYKCLLNTETIQNMFDDAKPAYTSFLGVSTALNIISIISDAIVVEPGALYSPGQKLSIIGGSGVNSSLEVHQVTTGSIDSVNIARQGKNYQVGDKVTFKSSFNEQAVNAEGYVSAVDGFGCEVVTLMQIDTITINNPGYNYVVGDVVELDIYDTHGIKVRADVVSVTSGSLTNTKVVQGGYDYQYAQALFYVDATHYWKTSCVLNGGHVKSVPIPDATINTTPTVYINGIGAAGTMTVSGTSITFSITSGGFNYISPILNTAVTGVLPQINFTTDAVGTITSITSTGTFSIPDGTYDFTVNERAGHGADITPVMGGRLTGVSIIGNPLFNEAKQTAYLTPFVPATGVQGSLNMTYTFNFIDIKTGGIGYDSPTLVITGGIGAGFKSRFSVDESGAIIGVYIDDSGFGYPVSSSASVITSTGTGASISLNVNDNGQIVSVNIISGGTGHLATDTILITTGQISASANVVVNAGSVTAFIMQDYGNYYTSVPKVSVLDDSPATYTVGPCHLAQGSYLISTTSSFNLVRVGHRVDYLVAGISVYNAIVTEVTDSQNIIVDTPAWDNAWTDVQLNFSVTRGKISQVTLTNNGAAYHALPTVEVESANGSEAKLTAISYDLGGILSVKVVDSGVNYEETPIIATPISGIINELSTQFRLGELVYDAYWPYIDTVNYSDGPHARVFGFRSDTNLLQLDNATDQFNFYTENNLEIIAEDDTSIVHEQSYAIDTSTVLKGSQSNATGSFKVIQRGTVIALNNSVCFSKEDFSSNSGMLSDPTIKLHDGKRIQDYSYFVKTFETAVNGQKNGMQLHDYKDSLTKLVHPAGYKMYGDVMLEQFQKIALKLFQKYDKFGNAVNANIILAFVLDTMILFSSTDYSAMSRHQIEIILEHYVNVLNNINYNEFSSSGSFKRRMIKLIFQMRDMFASMRGSIKKSQLGINFDVLYPSGFKPIELEQNKFKFKPYAGMTEQTDVLSLWSGFSYVNDINYYGVNSTYWDYPNTVIGNFSNVTFDEIINNKWANRINEAYVLDSYMTIAVRLDFYVDANYITNGYV